MSGPYCDLPQGYESTASYQVKPYLTGSVLSLTAFASVFPGPPVQAIVNYSGTPWVRVEIPEEVEFELEVMNNVKSGKEALISLKYLGPEGKSTAVAVNPSQRISYSTTEYEAEWEDLAAGVYQFSWEANGIKSGSRLVTLTAPKEKYQEKCIP